MRLLSNNCLLHIFDYIRINPRMLLELSIAARLLYCVVLSTSFLAIANNSLIKEKRSFKRPF